MRLETREEAQLLQQVEQATLLIVDDEEIIRDLCARALKDYRILQAENGQAALKILDQQDVDLILADIIMPIIGLITGGMDFSDLSYQLKAAALGPDGKEIPAVTINYGKFINLVITFLIVAFTMFMVIKGMNQLKRKEAAAPPAPPAPSTEEKLLTEIRDLLAKGR